MTTTSDIYYPSGWEFKTVHSRWGEFDNPYHINRLIREESLAEWTMVEQMGPTAVRFCRPTSARSRDYQLPPGVDPYRTLYTYTAETEVQMTDMLFHGALVLAILLVILVLAIVCAM